MKAVPISQYLDHIGRVAQADAQSPRRDAAPFRPRAIRVVESPETRAPGPLAFSQALRDAASAARAREEGGQSAEADERAASGEGAFSGSRKAPSAADVEMLVAEAYGRGVTEGLAIARAEDGEALARERARLMEQALVERLDFQVNEYAQLADAIGAGLLEIEQRVAASVARILAPLLTSELSKRVVDELCANLARLRAGGSPGLIKIRGPERLLAALRDRVSFLPVEVEFAVEDGVEATIEAQQTVIRSELQPWADLIASIVA